MIGYSLLNSIALVMNSSAGLRNAMNLLDYERLLKNIFYKEDFSWLSQNDYYKNSI